MKFYVRQRFNMKFLEQFEVYDEHDKTIFTAMSEYGIKNNIVILDGDGNSVAEIRYKFFKTTPSYEVFKDGKSCGLIRKTIKLMKNNYEVEYKGWKVDGDFKDLEFTITDYLGRYVASIYKEKWRLLDRYALEVKEDEDVLDAVLAIVAIDLEQMLKFSTLIMSHY